MIIHSHGETTGIRDCLVHATLFGHRVQIAAESEQYRECRAFHQRRIDDRDPPAREVFAQSPDAVLSVWLSPLLLHG